MNYLSSVFKREGSQKIVQKENGQHQLPKTKVLHLDYLEIKEHKNLGMGTRILFLLTENYLYFVGRQYEVNKEFVCFTYLAKIELTWLSSYFYEDDRNDPNDVRYMFYLLKEKKSILFKVDNEKQYQIWQDKLMRLTIARDLFKTLVVEKFIKQGLYYRMYKLRNAFTQEEFCCKRFKKKDLIPEYLPYLINEIKILKKLKGHPNIIEIKYLFESENSVYVVLEKYSQQKCIRKKIPHNAEYIAYVMKIMMDVLSYMSSKSIVHRNLKPGNIVFQYSNEDIYKNCIKVVGFELACFANKNQTIYLHGGTKDYMAPESINNPNYKPNCKYDMYSLGVTLYSAVTGKKLACRKDMDKSRSNSESSFDELDIFYEQFQGIPERSKLNRQKTDCRYAKYKSRGKTFNHRSHF